MKSTYNLNLYIYIVTYIFTVCKVVNFCQLNNSFKLYIFEKVIRKFFDKNLKFLKLIFNFIQTLKKIISKVNWC